MRTVLALLLPSLLACSAVEAPEDATYAVRAAAISGDCGPQPVRTVRIWRDAEGAHLRNVGASAEGSCRLQESAGALLGSCPGPAGVQGDHTIVIEELGAELSGELYVMFPGSCSGRYALRGDRL